MADASAKAGACAANEVRGSNTLAAATNVTAAQQAAATRLVVALGAALVDGDAAVATVGGAHALLHAQDEATAVAAAVAAWAWAAKGDCARRWAMECKL